ncbi:hypothetical protein C8Q78DRAFT_541367 [Trametes maxima]|nr:hypothetical protein C8Q78DRAFT_541367 [Trametes maxima]
MVSFQCDACGDIVKKPKLDKHRMACHSSFTCIDCSTTFEGPTQYKGHTTCISEAEKYQKALYKGPKTGQSGGPRGSNNANGGQQNGYSNGGANGNAGGAGAHPCGCRP